MSEFAIVETLDTDRWEAFVQQHPKGTIFHTHYMQEVFRQTKNYTPYFLAAINAQREVLALLAAVRVQTLPDPLGWIASRSIWYAEPICRDDEAGIAALVALIRQHDRMLRHKVLFTEIRPIWEAGAERVALERCGYEYYDYLNFMGDLTSSAEDLWNGMIKTCRADIRRSKKRGMHVEEMNTQEGVDVLYHFTQMSYERSRVPLADISMFQAAVRVLQPHTMVRIFIAYQEDKTPLAADIILFYKDLVYAWYGGVQRVKGVFPVECLTWHEIELGKQLGFAHYDFGGAGKPDEPYGVRDFKAKFGAPLVNYGRYRKVYSQWKLELAERAYELRRELQGRWHEWKTRRTTGEQQASEQPAEQPAAK
ncbi:MAG: peptidoglycan bridge formation glycyltransferase FemA/FemB family protein [Chloroflexaceae bacterium]|nr:peptidoglycan bridge formation glycyltransferase FemA/FemB family protein [Chloroflexaceae bacterium]NJO05064.1 peptidoglycan bridge formation glycyltransferase FemA/FemB family protein [Chloroflexaceae bacterium]